MAGDELDAMSTEAADSPVPSVRMMDVRALVAELRKEGGWMKRKPLAVAIGRDGKPACERKVRRIASVAAPRVVSYPGSPGYCLLENCSEEEVEHCINALRAQGQDMICRANLYQHAFNKRRTSSAPAEVQESLALSI